MVFLDRSGQNPFQEIQIAPPIIETGSRGVRRTLSFPKPAHRIFHHGKLAKARRGDQVEALVQGLVDLRQFGIGAGGVLQLFAKRRLPCLDLQREIRRGLLRCRQPLLKFTVGCFGSFQILSE